MNLKLQARKEELIAEIESMAAVIEQETRAFNEDEIKAYEEKTAEIERLEKTIQATEQRSKYKVEKPDEKEVRSLLDDIKSVNQDSNKEIEIGMREVRNITTSGTHVMNAGTAQTTVGQTHIGIDNIAKKTFADTILDKLIYISPLYAAVRKERFGTSTYQIPVQANRLGMFVPMKELEAYAKKNADFTPINLQAHKFGTLITFSQEVLEDTGYNVEGNLLTQLTDSYAQTLDQLLVVGSAAIGVEGLNSFAAADGSAQVAVPATIETDALLDMYHALPIPYRRTATWVMDDEKAKILSKLKDGHGRPLLTESYNNSPFGSQAMLLNRPVIINQYAANKIYFGDLNKALICGERKSLMIQKSLEYGFITDEVAIKANMRMDIKKALGEAMVVGTVAAAAAASSK